jgi:starch-binding outer membrane protein, SusD/RagB family
MKKIINLNLLIAASLSFFIGGCTDLVVENLDSRVEQDKSGAPTGNPELLLQAAYNDLGEYCAQENIYALGQHTSDEMIPPTRGTDWGDNGVWRTLDQHTWDPTHAQVLNTWNQLNERVFKATVIIDNATPKASAQQKAEALFVRAFNMFHVMDYYGQVPFRNVTDGVDVLPKVMTRSEAFDFIVKDLEEALPNLETKGPAASNKKATKAAARFLLAKLHLNKAVYKNLPSHDANDMQKVIDLVKLIEADGYGLADDYFTTFSKNSAKENIFTTDQGNRASRWYMTLHYDQNPSGWNGFTTLADFYGKFEDKDIRKGVKAKADSSKYSGIGKGFLVGQQVDDNNKPIIEQRGKTPLVFTPDVPLAGANVKQGIRVIKYHPADNGDYIFMRYADAYLMAAEAKLRKGDKAAALADVNALRTKRGASTLGDLTLEAMLDERGRELYWEGGRRTDQIRFGTFTKGVSNTGAHTVLFPIPAAAIVSNPTIRQNPGY